MDQIENALTHSKTPITSGSSIATELSDLESDAIGPDLQAVVAAWGTLPDAIRAGIVAMVEAVKRRPEQRQILSDLDAAGAAAQAINGPNRRPATLCKAWGIHRERCGIS